jgi:hypothetical protein
MRLSAARPGPVAGTAADVAPDPADPSDLPCEGTVGPWQVRRAGLVDVNPIARMIQQHRPFIDLDGDGEPDEVPDPEHAAPATRLVLSLGALEHGEVWFAQDAAGVAAVAVWMPPDAEHLAGDLHRVVARELGEPSDPDPEPAHAPLRSIVGGTTQMLGVLRESDSRRVLIMLADAGRTAPEDRRTLLADVLAPVVTAELLDGRSVLAVTVDPDQVADLQALGFGEVRTAPLGAAALWLGAMRPAEVEAPGSAAGDAARAAGVAAQRGPAAEPGQAAIATA